MPGHSLLISVGSFAFFSRSVSGEPEAMSKQRSAFAVPRFTAVSTCVGLAAAAVPKSRFSPLAAVLNLSLKLSRSLFCVLIVSDNCRFSVLIFILMLNKLRF